MSEDLLSTAAVAEILNVSPTGLRIWERDGRIPPAFARVLPGGRRVWQRRDIESIRDAGGVLKRDRPRREPAA